MTKSLLSWLPSPGRKIFFHGSSSVSTNTSYSLFQRHYSYSLTHYHFISVCWNAAGCSQEQVLGAAMEPEPCPHSQADWLEHTHCVILKARNMFAKLPFPWCSCIWCWCRLVCYFLLLFCQFLSPCFCLCISWDKNKILYFYSTKHSDFLTSVKGTLKCFMQC